MVVVLAPLTRSLASTIRTGPGRLTEGTPMAVSVLAVSASAWGVLMGLSPVLQIRRMLRERSSRQVSLSYFAILLAGFLLWISYGIAARNVWLVVPNSIALLVGLTLVAVALRLRRRLSVYRTPSTAANRLLRPQPSPWTCRPRPPCAHPPKFVGKIRCAIVPRFLPIALFFPIIGLNRRREVFLVRACWLGHSICCSMSGTAQ
jgi:uncharacterized protein with PQ loop repeat